MKKILVTGKTSYIGSYFERWASNYSDRYCVDSITVRDNKWENESFREYDVIIHVAGIAHENEKNINEYLYYEINRDLTVSIANKAKKEGVKQFIFLSSMSVYGINKGVITKETAPNPTTNYGRSKYQAEEKILSIANKKFIVSVIRPPMVYGKNCKGNFSRIKTFINISPIFINVKNERSMIYIENLCEFIRLTIDNEIGGILYPQNSEYVCTSKLVRLMSESKNKKITQVKGFNKIISIISNKFDIKILSKIFGNLVYEQNMSDIGYDYNIVNFEESIKRSIDSDEK